MRERLAAWARLVPLLLLATLAGGGCAGKYLYAPLGEVVAQPRAKDCEFLLAYGVPEVAYDSLGVLAPKDIQAPKVPDQEAAFKSAIQGQVCAAGGDAVVAERNGQGQYIRATIIKVR